MNKKTALVSLIIVSLLAIGFFVAKGQSNNTDTQATAVMPANNTTNASAPMSVAPADKIEIVHFHGTQQCVSCITVGKYALQTIKDKFPEEYASGKIVFKEINAELPENQAIVTQYQARGSSLFVNAIRSEKDNITEDTTVWRLVNSESQYTTYFGGKLAALLGK
jgi:hypothetical protein